MIDWIDIKNTGYDYYINIPCLTKRVDLYEAAKKNIEYILDNYPPPYTLMLSGGVDSQAMLYFWNYFGYSFEIFSARYNNDMNWHDLQNLVDFCSIHNIPLEFYDFDVLSFLDNEYITYVEKYRCGSPHICTYMKLSELVNKGTVLFSGNFVQTNFVSQNMFGLYRYAKTASRNMVPYFLCETQDFSFSLNFFSKNKTENYILNNIPVIPQKNTYSGFENIKEYYDIHKKHLVQFKDKFYRVPTQRSNRTFDLLLRNKYEYKFREDKYVVRCYNA